MSCRLLSRSGLALAGVLALAAVTAAPAAAQTRYIAFGDSITAGTGDDNPARASAPGYTSRLQDLLVQRGQTGATVINQGMPGETTSEAVTRFGSVPGGPGDVLLLLEGTNDIGNRVSIETVRRNLAEIANRAEARGMSVVHTTVIPRLPDANFDGDNRVTEKVDGGIRDLAWANERKLADAFEVFFYGTPNLFADDYAGGIDKLHPNGKGYDLLAKVFADTITGVDVVGPVHGFLDPEDGDSQIPGSTPIRIDLYDFGAGLDLAATKLVVNGVEVSTPLSGSEKKVEIRYAPPTPLSGVVTVRVRSQDKATPPNVLDRQLVRYFVVGTTFLPGDLDRNGRVDGADLVALALHFGSRRGEPGFDTHSDLNADAAIDGQDLAVLAMNFGRSSI